jgi:hypothetical protein
MVRAVRVGSQRWTWSLYVVHAAAQGPGCALAPPESHDTARLDPWRTLPTQAGVKGAGPLAAKRPAKAAKQHARRTCALEEQELRA